MDTLISVLLFIVSLGVLLFLHELGHYLMTRLARVEVEEFGFGLPPRMVKLFNIGATAVTLNWIPFGAFVKPKGENDPEISGGLGAANPWARLGVMLGGPGMNLLAGILLLAFVFSYFGLPAYDVKIQEVSSNSPAEAAGLLAGDKILRLNDTLVTDYTVIQQIVQRNLDNEISVTVQRESSELTVRLVPRKNPPAGQGAIGILMQAENPSFIRKPITQAVALAVTSTVDQARQLLQLPFQLIAGTMAPQDARVVGIVGIFDIFNQARTADVESGSSASPLAPAPGFYTILTVASISIALGFTNLLPLPALDGGRILFLLPELIIKRRVPARYENYVHAAGLMILLLLMVVVTIQDIIVLAK